MLRLTGLYLITFVSVSPVILELSSWWIKFPGCLSTSICSNKAG